MRWLDVTRYNGMPWPGKTQALRQLPNSREKLSFSPAAGNKSVRSCIPLNGVEDHLILTLFCHISGR
jgi:hypothetical protein